MAREEEIDAMMTYGLSGNFREIFLAKNVSNQHQALLSDRLSTLK